MPRNYPQPAVSCRAAAAAGRLAAPLLLAAGTLAATSLAALTVLPGSAARSGDLFAALPVQESRFAILARPVGSEDWNLLVLEQLAAKPSCWTRRPDGLIDPSLNRFNFAGICSRYLDSNGYSLRIGEQDLASSYRLKLVQVGEELRLLASSVSSPADLLVGRARVPLRDRDGFVQLSLEPGWNLQRRSYQGRGLSHLYFANGDSLPLLLARLQNEQASLGAAGSPERGNRILSRLGGLGPNAAGAPPSLTSLADRGAMATPGRPVPLQVIPFRE